MFDVSKSSAKLTINVPEDTSKTVWICPFFFHSACYGSHFRMLWVETNPDSKDLQLFLRSFHKPCFLFTFYQQCSMEYFDFRPSLTNILSRKSLEICRQQKATWKSNIFRQNRSSDQETSQQRTRILRLFTRWSWDRFFVFKTSESCRMDETICCQQQRNYAVTDDKKEHRGFWASSVFRITVFIWVKTILIVFSLYFLWLFY